MTSVLDDRLWQVAAMMYQIYCHVDNYNASQERDPNIFTYWYT